MGVRADFVLSAAAEQRARAGRLSRTDRPRQFSLCSRRGIVPTTDLKRCADASRRSRAPPDGALMARRAGSADLPLHGGRVPQWLGERMTRLGAVITEAIVLEYGRDEMLRRLAHPFWFQSFGAVMGMDWHSSGITTSVIGALKRGLTPLSRRTRHPCLRRPRQPFAPDARMSWSRSASGSGSTAPRSPRPAGWSPRSTAPRCRTGSTSICTASSSPMTGTGSWCSRA